jgi:ribonuclease HI
MRSSVLLYTDGASRGNPGLAGAGAVAIQNGKLLFELSEFLGEGTNNYAEYMALILALEKLLDIKEENNISLEIYADSKLLIEQLKGSWKVKHPNIKPLFARASNLLKGFADVKLKHLPREENRKADALANLAIDRHA